MNEKTVFIIPKDLTVIENENELVLRKGFLHVNELIIDKNGSSRKFLDMMRELVEEGKVCIGEYNEVYEDFMKLLKFGFLGIESCKSFLVLTSSKYIEFVSSICKTNVKAEEIKDVISVEEQKDIREEKDFIKIEKIKDKIREKVKDYDHFYVIDDFCNLTSLRAVNKLANMLDIESTIGFIDNDNIYMTAIKPKYTGCYECLENHILSKFPGVMADYERKFTADSGSCCEGNLLILLGWIFKDIENIEKYGMSSLTGNVIHMYTPNFEYTYSANMKSSACSVCAGLNHVRFEEQNIRSVNVIEEAFNND